MTDQEREIVLKMIEEGRISPEEGLSLMNALKESASDDKDKVNEASRGEGEKTVNVQTGSHVSGEPSGMSMDPRLERLKSTARSLWQIPLYIGIAITVGSALGMDAIQRNAGMNFWFFCLILPLTLGILAIVAAIGSRTARWLYVDVQQKPGDKPQRIFLGFPLPLKFTAWFLRTFGHHIHIDKVDGSKMHEIIEVVESGLSENEPLIVNVDEGKDGERVQVYIG